jgi:hypothetical protein
MSWGTCVKRSITMFYVVNRPMARCQIAVFEAKDVYYTRHF